MQASIPNACADPAVRTARPSATPSTTIVTVPRTKPLSVRTGSSIAVRRRWLADYGAVTADTEQIIGELPDLDASHPLPAARRGTNPGRPGRSGRVLVHVIAETSQHAGHADILREAIDGTKTMG